MGRGDKKTVKGKITIGSYGVSRKRADNKKTFVKKDEKAVKTEA